MSALKLSHRYAKSLLDLAVEMSKLEEVYKDVLYIDECIQASIELKAMLRNPIFTADQKMSVLRSLFAEKSQDITWRFIELVVKKGREKHLVDFGYSFVNQYRELKKIKKVSITTADALSDKTMQSLKNLVSTFQREGSIEIEEKLDPSIIGGFKLQYEDQLYDASISKHLTELSKQLYDESYIDKV